MTLWFGVTDCNWQGEIEAVFVRDAQMQTQTQMQKRLGPINRRLSLEMYVVGGRTGKGRRVRQVVMGQPGRALSKS